MDNNELLSRLSTLSTQAGENYYERIEIADTLLKDKEWIKLHYSSDAFRAAEHLQECYFHDLCGLMTLWDLMHIYRKFPKKEDWIAHNYNLRKMHELVKVKPTTVSTTVTVGRRSAKVADLEKLEVENSSMRRKIQLNTTAISEKDQKIAALELRVKTLEAEKARLLDRVRELERLIEREK